MRTVASMKPQLHQRKSPTLALNRRELDKLHSLSEKQLAAAIGVDESTLWRVTHGEVSPSAGFIAKVKLAFPLADLNRVFTVLKARKAVAA